MRKTFLLGGSPFTAPDPIGAGVRARISQITSEIAEIKKVENKPEDIIQRYFYDYSLRLLEIILQPSDGGPSVKDAYDSATDEEVQLVMDFFALNAGGKTKSASSKTSGSNASKKTAKVKT